jgi:seryl-tRNA synthetase
MTPAQLSEIKLMAEKATKGPWTVRSYEGYGYSVIAQDKEISAIDEDTNRVQLLSDDDAKFIAHARQDIPALLAHISELSEKIGQLEAENRQLIEKVEEFKVNIKRISWRGPRWECPECDTKYKEPHLPNCWIAKITGDSVLKVDEKHSEGL